MLNNLVGGILGKVVDNAEGILDKVITTDKERDAAKFEIKKLLLLVLLFLFKNIIKLKLQIMTTNLIIISKQLIYLNIYIIVLIF